MTAGIDKAAQYRAIVGKDKKFDGIFYFAVSTTGVYCRPSCPAPTPPQKNCAFFDTIENATLQGYEACKRCHPGRLKNDLSVEILESINAGAINDDSVHALADSMRMSERHLRRVVQDRTGISPTRLNTAKRLSAAKRLVTQTKLPIIEVAFNVGFSSLRQFNDVFRGAFKTSPREMRKSAVSDTNKTINKSTS